MYGIVLVAFLGGGTSILADGVSCPVALVQAAVSNDTPRHAPILCEVSLVSPARMIQAEFSVAGAVSVSGVVISTMVGARW